MKRVTIQYETGGLKLELKIGKNNLKFLHLLVINLTIIISPLPRGKSLLQRGVQIILSEFWARAPSNNAVVRRICVWVSREARQETEKEASRYSFQPGCFSASHFHTVCRRPVWKFDAAGTPSAYQYWVRTNTDGRMHYPSMDKEEYKETRTLKLSSADLPRRLIRLKFTCLLENSKPNFLEKVRFYFRICSFVLFKELEEE